MGKIFKLILFLALSIFALAAPVFNIKDTASCPPSPDSPPAKPGSPNIVLFLTDDLDLTLGGMIPLKKTNTVLSEQGATAKSWFIHSPVCCASRAELLTGRYFHNLKTSDSSKKSCMHISVNAKEPNDPFYSQYYFAPHLQQAGYTVGIFGKHLNNNNPKCPPPGVDRWFANGGGNYFSPTFSWASANTSASNVQFKNCTYNKGSCYSTSVIGNQSLSWIREVFSQPTSIRKPFFAYIAVKAPHIQDGPGWPITLPAPWYNEAFPSVIAPRTPNWNASCLDHHWLIRQQPPMTAEEAMHSDNLYRARWQSLLSVDDLVEDVVSEIENAGESNNTYFILTSDHGFRFGQFRMPQGKWNVYENDLRIPFVIRGPGVMKNSTFDWMASNVDTMPTILGLAGVSTPTSMDGRSLAHLLVNSNDAPTATQIHLKKHREMVTDDWRTEQLIEYSLGNVVRYAHMEDAVNNSFRALRIIDPTAAVGEQNLKLAEFTDLTSNWNFTKPADEFELFNLNNDPFELKNIYNSAPANLKQRLHKTLKKLYQCQSTSCN